jgi:hypothetical protein
MNTTAAAGERTQHLAALEYANQVRVARAELKRQIAAGELSVAAVVQSCPWQAASMPVGSLLKAQRRWGSARCRRFLVALDLSEKREVGALTERQRAALVSMLEARSPQPCALTAVPTPSLAEPHCPDPVAEGRALSSV